MKMRHEMKHVFEETIQDIERIPKELVREYETATGRMAREIGPLVYGYSYTVGADGKPQFREFGNIRPLQRSLRGRGRPGLVHRCLQLSASLWQMLLLLLLIKR